MSAPDSTKIQANFKVGGTLINIYASNPDEFAQELTLLESLAPTIAAVDGILQAAGNLGSVAAPASQAFAQPAPSSAPAQALGAWQQNAAQQAGGFAAYEQAAAQQGPPPGWAAAPAAPAGKVCAHGAMTYKEGTSQSTGKAWKAYFCPTPKGTPGQCSPEFIR